MSLTGKPLILLAASITLLALGATVLLWRRGGRWRLLIRPLGVLLTEALLILTCGLYANRHEQFYPTWGALLAAGDNGPVAHPTPAGALDGGLADDPPPGGTFAWRPAGWEKWGLAGAPAVTMPADYGAHPDRVYPVVVIVVDSGDAPGHDGTDLSLGAGEAAPETAGRDAVLITVPVAPSTPPEVLATGLPAAAGHDLRVTTQRWALVVPARLATAVAVPVIGAAAPRYPSVAIIGVRPKDGSTPGGSTPTGGSTMPGGLALPEGVAVRWEGTRAAAIDWAVKQTPPPLVPVAAAGTAAGTTSGPADRGGERHGAEQSRR
ncbi:hypothetical protein ACIA8K_33180 [Catenuloplanes sp. NPDC051500]|uniref:hypothetical protein n=1 Tax=Catenuloplanes sp. NPDC051500 TaxID=3363959 RepID=UPI0037AB6742